MGKVAQKKPRRNRKKTKKNSGLKSIEKRKTELLPVLLGPKNSNGTTNWDKLSKMLGYASSKTSPKQSASKAKVKPSPFAGRKLKFRKFVNNENVENADSKLQQNGSKSSSTHDKFPAIRDIGNSLPTVKAETTFQNGTIKKNENSSATDQSEYKRLTKQIAMDCEMVGTGDTGRSSMVARVSLVNRFGDCVYDSYVKPKDDITDYRTHVSGIRPADLVNGKDLFTVQKEVLQILDGRILVGHSLKNDLDVLFISHPRLMIRDTSRYRPFREMFSGQTPSLKKLTAKILGVNIQTGEHNSVEDARATMQVYRMHKSEWEKSIKLRRRFPIKKRPQAVSET